ncbi:MAG: hypothetical protein WDN08_09275 [Rhizomicrobium sp.]
MTTIRLAAALLAATVLAVPAFAEDPAPATPAAPAIAPPVAPPTTGRVYISYPAQDKATYDSQFAIDDAWLADAIKPGTCVYFDLPPGKHTMHTTATANWYVELAAGDAKYADLKYRGGSINNVVPVDGTAPVDLTACLKGTPPGG